MGDVGVEDLIEEQAEPETFDDVPENDVDLASDTKAPASIQKEHAILWNNPIAEITLPNGKTLPIYAKSEGQLELIDEAFQAWLDAMIVADRRSGKLWRRWEKRRKTVNKELTNVQMCKGEFFRRIFEDQYVSERHVELSAEDFLCTDIATQKLILDAHQKANDGTDILAAMIPEFESKKKRLLQVISPDGTHI